MFSPPHASLRFDKKIFLCLLCSLLVNVAYLQGAKDYLELSGDAVGYDKVGYELAEGKGFPTVGGYQPKRPPLYLMFVGGIYAIAGHDPQAVRWVQGMIASVFCLLVYMIAGELADAGVLSRAVPLWSAILTMFYPGYVLYAGLLYREILIIFFLLVALYFLTKYVIASRPAHAVWFGVFLALTSLADNRFAYYPLLLAAVFCLYWGTVRKPLAFVLLTYGVMAVLISPWTIRNYVVLDRFVPIATAQDKGLWISTYPGELLEWDWSREPLKTYATMDPEEREKLMAKEGIENLKKYPLAYAKMSAKRFVRLWAGGHSNLVPGLEKPLAQSLAEGGYGIAAAKLIFLIVNMAYLVGGAIGCVLLCRKAGAGYFLHFLALFAYLSVIHTLVFAAPRYHLPLIPIFTICLAYLVHSYGGRRQTVAAVEPPTLVSHGH
ncbi:MAG: glycosyltransferase family 39 protein [Desulfomonile tiedjei]|nr:glycosyltransferase family 39 protein [Desulfomonile tiedjei]